MGVKGEFRRDRTFQICLAISQLYSNNLFHNLSHHHMHDLTERTQTKICMY